MGSHIRNFEQNVRNPIPDNMVINGVDCSDKQVIADNFNNFFASIGKLNASNIGRHHDSSYQDYLPERTVENCKKATPIYKKDDKKLIKNYRPISVLPVISKVFDLRSIE